MKKGTVGSRQLSLLMFNDVVMRSNRGGVIDPSTYSYFDYVDEPTPSLMDNDYDMALSLSIRILFQSAMGSAETVYSLYGLTINDLLNMTFKEFKNFEEQVEELAEAMNKEPPKEGEFPKNGQENLTYEYGEE